MAVLDPRKLTRSRAASERLRPVVVDCVGVWAAVSVAAVHDDKSLLLIAAERAGEHGTSVSLLAAALSSSADSTLRESSVVVVASCSRRELMVVVVVVVRCRCCWSDVVEAVTETSADKVPLSSDTESRGDEPPEHDSALSTAPAPTAAATATAVFKSQLSVKVSQDAIGASFGLHRLAAPVAVSSAPALGTTALDSSLSSDHTTNTRHTRGL